jgi:hypothetical protein
MNWPAYIFCFLWRYRNTGIPDKMRVIPIIASRGRVMKVLKTNPMQNIINNAGTTG